LSGLRPQDVVGAFATESGVRGNQIGAIEIADKYTLVELPEHLVDPVVAAMSNAPIRGHKVVVRRFVEKKR
jgi:ATP-dependent RNA helicase DeaD